MTEAVLFLGHHFAPASQDSPLLYFCNIFPLSPLFPRRLFRGIRQVKGYGCLPAYKLDGALHHSKDEYASGIVTSFAGYEKACGTVFTF